MSRRPLSHQLALLVLALLIYYLCRHLPAALTH